ncbi:MAG: FtsH protease activity modulator HflK [Gammaproteobacteria bacterium]|nr:FtsH protease activity modulator HflK [Gammaproteobacteria bacterium]
MPESNKKPEHNPWTGTIKHQKELESLLKKARLKTIKLPSGRKLIMILVAIIIASWLGAGVYQVPNNRCAVVTRDNIYRYTVKTGVHWLPAIIYQHTLVNITPDNSIGHSAEFLTKDRKLVDISISAQYQIINPEAYIANNKDPKELLEQSLIASTYKTVISHTLKELQNNSKLNANIQNKLQKLIIKYGLGIKIIAINLEPIKLPEALKNSLEDIKQAKLEADLENTSAKNHADEVIAKSKQQAKQIIEAAKDQAKNTILQAKTRTAEFLTLLPQYEQAPTITRTKMYFDTMEQLLKHAKKILITTKDTNNSFYLPPDTANNNQPQTDKQEDDANKHNAYFTNSENMAKRAAREGYPKGALSNE